MSQAPATKFTADNYKAGFLIDEELMAGISDVKDQPGTYTAYVVRHTTGETLGVQQFTNLFEAIRTINEIPRPWEFESVKRCGSGNCSNGKCSAGGCGGKKMAQAEESAAAAIDAAACESGIHCQK